jgi:alkanesulfonate monooxygenase SsuD/methylene tetrahydromethanopterin reductase-like flavin-dependent oxidoreductase (luciferase family)
VRADVFLLAGQFPGTSPGQALANTVTYALAAEQAGFTGAWIAEHHFGSYGSCPSALTLAGYLLGATTTLRIGTAACVLSSRHPVAVGEEAALLTEVSGGRLDLGVARGGPWVDLEVFGTGLARYATGFPESLDLLRAWLSGDREVSADGTHHRFRAVTVVPRPSRPVPLWVAATSAETAALAAAARVPLLLGMHEGTRGTQRLLDTYRAVAGQGCAPHARAHLAYVADRTDQARRALQAAMPAWLAAAGSSTRIDGTPGPARDPDQYLQQLMAIHPVGDPGLCAERLSSAIAGTGVRHLLLLVEGAGDPAATVENIRRLGAEVIPRLNCSGPAAAGGPASTGQHAASWSSGGPAA